MSKAFESTGYTGQTGLFFRLNSALAASGIRIGRFIGIPWDHLADRFIRRLGNIRQALSPEEPISTDRAGNPHALDETRNRAYLDICRNIR